MSNLPLNLQVRRNYCDGNTSNLNSTFDILQNATLGGVGDISVVKRNLTSTTSVDNTFSVIEDKKGEQKNATTCFFDDLIDSPNTSTMCISRIEPPINYDHHFLLDKTPTNNHESVVRTANLLGLGLVGSSGPSLPPNSHKQSIPRNAKLDSSFNFSGDDTMFELGEGGGNQSLLAGITVELCDISIQPCDKIDSNSINAEKCVLNSNMGASGEGTASKTLESCETSPIKKVEDGCEKNLSKEGGDENLLINFSDCGLSSDAVADRRGDVEIPRVDYSSHSNSISQHPEGVNRSKNGAFIMSSPVEVENGAEEEVVAEEEAKFSLPGEENLIPVFLTAYQLEQLKMLQHKHEKKEPLRLAATPVPTTSDETFNTTLPASKEDYGACLVNDGTFSMAPTAQLPPAVNSTFNCSPTVETMLQNRNGTFVSYSTSNDENRQRSSVDSKISPSDNTTFVSCSSSTTGVAAVSSSNNTSKPKATISPFQRGDSAALEEQKCCRNSTISNDSSLIEKSQMGSFSPPEALGIEELEPKHFDLRRASLLPQSTPIHPNMLQQNKREEFTKKGLHCPTEESGLSEGINKKNLFRKTNLFSKKPSSNTTFDMEDANIASCKDTRARGTVTSSGVKKPSSSSSFASQNTVGLDSNNRRRTLMPTTKLNIPTNHSRICQKIGSTTETFVKPNLSYSQHNNNNNKKQQGASSANLSNNQPLKSRLITQGPSKKPEPSVKPSIPISKKPEPLVKPLVPIPRKPSMISNRGAKSGVKMLQPPPSNVVGRPNLSQLRPTGLPLPSATSTTRRRSMLPTFGHKKAT